MKGKKLKDTSMDSRADLEARLALDEACTPVTRCHNCSKNDTERVSNRQRQVCRHTCVLRHRSVTKTAATSTATSSAHAPAHAPTRWCKHYPISIVILSVLFASSAHAFPHRHRRSVQHRDTMESQNNHVAVHARRHDPCAKWVNTQHDATSPLEYSQRLQVLANRLVNQASTIKHDYEKHLKEKHQLADDAKDYFINSELTHNRIYAIAEESELAFVGDQINELHHHYNVLRHTTRLMQRMHTTRRRSELDESLQNDIENIIESDGDNHLFNLMCSTHHLMKQLHREQNHEHDLELNHEALSQSTSDLDAQREAEYLENSDSHRRGNDLGLLYKLHAYLRSTLTAIDSIVTRLENARTSSQ